MTGNKKVTKYNPNVLITIRIKPKVRIVIGNNNIFTIGFRINSKKAKIKEALMIVNNLSGPKERFPQISWCRTKAKAR